MQTMTIAPTLDPYAIPSQGAYSIPSPGPYAFAVHEDDDSADFARIAPPRFFTEPEGF